MWNRRTPMLAAVALAVALTPAAAAADTRVVVERNSKFQRTFEAIAECPGYTFTEHFVIRRTTVEVYDDHGNLLRKIVHVHFNGTATHDETGGTLPVDGFRHLVFDYEGGTVIVTETGVLRRITVRGEGIVLHDAGRMIENLEDETVTFSAGPHQLRQGDLSRYCTALAQA